MQLHNKEIEITVLSTLNDIQSAFTAYYPCLKIEPVQDLAFIGFFRRMPDVDKSTVIEPPKKLTEGKININGDRKVAEVLAELSGLMNRTIRMYRKSGSIWSLITVTDGWTLQSQNAEGAYISALMLGN